MGRLAMRSQGVRAWDEPPIAGGSLAGGKGARGEDGLEHRHRPDPGEPQRVDHEEGDDQVIRAVQEEPQSAQGVESKAELGYPLPSPAQAVGLATPCLATAADAEFGRPNELQGALGEGPPDGPGVA